MGGFTLVEIVVALALGSILLLALTGVVSAALKAAGDTTRLNALNQELRYALDEITRVVTTSPGLLLPLADNPATNWREDRRQQTIPASAPEGSSTFASAVLAVLLSRERDADLNGIADADNDSDGAFDEDTGSDANADGKPGIKGIDDDGDGSIDEGTIVAVGDDDEDGLIDEDGIAAANVDNDGDGSIDEDLAGDANNDLQPGVKGIDDDNDGSIDDGGFFNSWNDDEDNATDEDWQDPVVVFIAGTDLVLRQPVPWDTDGDGDVDARDVVEAVIATNVSQFMVERLTTTAAISVRVYLELRDPMSGVVANAQVQLRVGGAR